MVPAALNRESLRFYQQDGSPLRGHEAYHHQTQDLARTLKTNLLVGAPACMDWRRVPLADDDRYFYVVPGRRYNSVYRYQPDGTQTPQRYDKIHRVPFGEYIPWVDGWPWLKGVFLKYLSPLDFDYSLQPGRARTVFELPIPPPPTVQSDPPNAAITARIATPICFEDAVSRVTRRMVYDDHGRKRADLLVNLTNDGWYPGTHQGPQHLQIAVFRCIENRVPMARSVNTGISGFIDSLGRVGPIAQSQDGHRQQVEAVARHTVRFDRRGSLFGRIGETPAWVLAAMTTACVLWAVVRPAHHPPTH